MYLDWPCNGTFLWNRFRPCIHGHTFHTQLFVSIWFLYATARSSIKIFLHHYYSDNHMLHYTTTISLFYVLNFRLSYSNVTSSNSIYFTDLTFVIEYEMLCLKRGDNPITVGWFMLFNATFNNISAISRLSVLLVEKTGVFEENHRPVASHWQTLSHNAISNTPCHKRDSITLRPDLD